MQRRALIRRCPNKSLKILFDSITGVPIQSGHLTARSSAGDIKKIVEVRLEIKETQFLKENFQTF